MESTPKITSRSRDIGIAAVGFVVLSVAFCYPAGLHTDCLPFGDGDAVASYFPYMLRTFDPVGAEVAGSFDPTLFTGLPESHSPFGRYYPPTLLLYMLLPPVLALGWNLVLHQAWAGLGAYLLVRDGGRSRTAAWLAGIIFAFGGFMVFHRGHVTIHQAGAWLPWVLWALERFRRTGSPLAAVLAGTFLAMHALPGHLHMVAMGSLVWLTYLGYFAISGPGTISRWRFVLGVGGACLLGAIGSLPQVLPMMEVASWSGYGEFDPGFASSGNLKARFLPGLLGPYVLGGHNQVPRAVGYWGLTEHGIFYGLMALALLTSAVVGMRLRRPIPPGMIQAAEEDTPADRGLARFWLILLFGSLILMLGDNMPLHRLLILLPIYNLFHIPARHVWIFGLALAWLAAFGLDAWRNREPAFRRTMFRWSAILLFGLLGTGLLLARTCCTWPTSPGLPYPGFVVPLACGIGLVGLFLLLSRAPEACRQLSVMIPALAFLELWLTIGTVGLSSQPAESVTQPKQFPEVVQRLRDRDPGLPRCVVQPAMWESGGNPWSVPAALGSAWGLSVQNAYTQSMPRSLGRLLGLSPYGELDLARLLMEERGLSAVGGRYILATSPEPRFSPGKGYQVVRREDLTWNGSSQAPKGKATLPRSEGGKTARLTAQTFLRCGQTHLLMLQLQSEEPMKGQVHIRLVQRVNRNESHTLLDTCFGSDDRSDSTLDVTQRFATWPGKGNFELAIEGNGMPAARLVDFEIWELTPTFAAKVEGRDPAAVWQLIQQQTSNPYPPLMKVGTDVTVYENPAARPLASFVSEVRPTSTDMEAAAATLASDRPVHEVCHVVAPGGRSNAWCITSPAAFASGTADVVSHRPDDIPIRTFNAGDGFLVLTVTRCKGWSATIDGQPTPIHAVDGPLMGVRVPPGDHLVRFVFRPVLAWAGIALAISALGGAWTVCLFSRFRDRLAGLFLCLRHRLIGWRRLAIRESQVLRNSIPGFGSATRDMREGSES